MCWLITLTVLRWCRLWNFVNFMFSSFTYSYMCVCVLFSKSVPFIWFNLTRSWVSRRHVSLQAYHWSRKASSRLLTSSILKGLVVQPMNTVILHDLWSLIETDVRTRTAESERETLCSPTDEWLLNNIHLKIVLWYVNTPIPCNIFGQATLTPRNRVPVPVGLSHYSSSLC
jgi:hypothetical protein